MLAFVVNAAIHLVERVICDHSKEIEDAVHEQLEYLAKMLMDYLTAREDCNDEKKQAD